MVVADWQPRGTHALAQEIDAVDPSALHVLTYSDIQYSFIEGSWATFGRDDAECTVPIWEALQGSELSRVAGVLWCIDGELWVRNLSQAHELVVTGGSTPHHLPPRPGSRRGAACTLPADRAMISAPSTGDWRITTMSMSRSQPDPALVPATVTLTRPPQALLPTAVALCAPLLQRGGRPATYQEIAIMTAAKPRTARDRVDRLVAFYDQQGCQRLWRRLDGDDSNYGPLARLLVYRSIVTAADLALLEPVADR